jgi:DNA protecting protein DprA
MKFSHVPLVRLQSTPGIGQRTMRKFLSWASESNQPLDALFDLPAEELKQRFKLKDDVAAALKGSHAEEEAESAILELDQHGFQLIALEDSAYPSMLLTQLGDDAPPLLYVKGDLTLLTHSGVAFSGSRHASEQGLRYTAVLVQDAVRRGLNVISGHAPGVDSAAHRTALQAGGVTFLVLPEGALRLTLRPELRDLAAQYPQNVVVLTQFPPRMPWSAQTAMIRNRTIIGLADALCVIEAGDSGGALGAGQSALKLGAPVFVLQYPEPLPSAPGNRLLIEQGAQPIPVGPEMTLPDLAAGAAPPDNTENPRQLSLFD